MIYMLGDIHGEWDVLNRLAKKINSDDIIIQVGDFGIYPARLMSLKQKFTDGFPCKLLIIDGNHEHFGIINEWSKNELTEFHSNFFYVPRGYIMEIQGQLFGFLGGAESIDKAWRVHGENWFAEERVQSNDIETLQQNLNGRQLDVLVTHSPPEFVNRLYFSKLREEEWLLPKGWLDESALQINKLHWATKPKKHYCGHMHRAITHDNVRIIDINEIVEHKP